MMQSENAMPCKAPAKKHSPKFRRQRLKEEEIAVLEREFEANSEWDYDFQKELAARLNFSRVKVYKWLYDRKVKELKGQA